MKSDNADADAELVARVRKGEDTAFTALVHRYRDAVCGIAFHHLQNGEDAQDAAQETFIQAYIHLFELREPHRFAPWLRRVAVNCCLDRLRKRSREAALLRQEEGLCRERFFPGSPLAAERDHLPDALSGRLFFQQISASLSRKVRLTVILFYISEYSHDEIARFLGVPVATVRSRLRYAKRQMREEIKTMAEEFIEEAKPGPDWTRRVVEEAVRRGQEALRRHARGEALSAFDSALAAADELQRTIPNTKNRRLALQVLRQKDAALGFTSERGERLALLEQALAAARALGDAVAEAELLQDMGRTETDRKRSGEYYTAALALFRVLGDPLKQAECLLFTGVNALFQDDSSAGKASLGESLKLFREIGALDWQGVCHALLEMLSDTEPVGLARLLLWAGMCDSLETEGGKVRFLNQPGFQLTRRKDEHPSSMFAGSVFWQISALRTFLDSHAAVGDSWSGEVFSFSYQPLQATMRVLSADQHVRVPAGDFARCLLMELQTSEGITHDDAPEQLRLLNQSILCGRRRAWYAPGVGLVQMHIEPGEGQGSGAQIHLQEYAVATDSQEYLPIAIGNQWTYGWANVSAEYAARESYHVTGQTGNRWHLAHSSYAYKKEH